MLIAFVLLGVEVILAAYKYWNMICNAPFGVSVGVEYEHTDSHSFVSSSHRS